MGKRFRFNMGKKRENMEPVEEPKPEEDVVEMSEDAYVEVDGEKVPVAELIENYANRKNMEEEPVMLDLEDTVTIEGVEVPVSELVNSYKGAACNSEDEPKENAEDPTDTELEDPVENSRKNSAGEVPKKNENFRKLENAATRGAERQKPDVNTKTKRLSRGASRYGSPVRNEGGK